MIDTDAIQSSEASPHRVAPFGHPAPQRISSFTVAIVGLATSLALFAGAFLQQGIDAWIHGPLPDGVIACADGFEKLCMVLLLLLNPQLFVLMVASVVLPPAWLPASVANPLVLALIPAWWGLLAWLSAHRSQRASYCPLHINARPSRRHSAA